MNMYRGRVRSVGERGMFLSLWFVAYGLSVCLDSYDNVGCREQGNYSWNCNSGVVALAFGCGVWSVEGIDGIDSRKVAWKLHHKAFHLINLFPFLSFHVISWREF